MFSISGKKEKKNSKLKIEIKFFRSGLFFTVGRERGNKSNFIFGLTYISWSIDLLIFMSNCGFLCTCDSCECEILHSKCP